ncbi:hypothetical protein [Desulfobulbus sp.]|uniref:hypothetical protein n=1 Tax=Desulfobulbus sp. TaxID=895 RepID=UPI00286F702B|nr:hypothetical protein [Desulfobulbus sp.]
MSKYSVLEPLAYDRPYAPGETVELAEHDAVWLLASGVVGEAIKANKGKGKDSEE